MNPGALLGACLCSVLQCALLAVAVAAILRAVRRLDAASRYRTWSLVLLAAVALPAIDLAVRTSRPLDPASPQRAFAAFVVAAPLAKALVVAWAAASSALLIRLAFSFARLRILCRRSGPVSAALEARAALHAGTLGLSSAVTIRSSRDIASPVAVELSRRVILVPERLLEMLSADELDYILVHELTHLRRSDGIGNLLVKLARALLVWNPVLIFVERRIAFERELACDDAVVARFGNAGRYARCLATVMLSAPMPAAVPFARSARHTLRRIEHLATGVRRTAAPPRMALLGIAATIALALCAEVSAPQFVALDVPLEQTVTAPIFDADFGLPRGAVVPAALELTPGVEPSFSPFIARGRRFVPKT